jgi:hypothetical protein
LALSLSIFFDQYSQLGRQVWIFFIPETGGQTTRSGTGHNSVPINLFDELHALHAKNVSFPAFGCCGKKVLLNNMTAFICF